MHTALAGETHQRSMSCLQDSHFGAAAFMGCWAVRNSTQSQDKQQLMPLLAGLRAKGAAGAVVCRGNASFTLPTALQCGG